MKKKYLFFVLSLVVLCLTTILTNSISINTVAVASNNNYDMTEFLQFEQAVIDLNNTNESLISNNVDNFLVEKNNTRQTSNLNEQTSNLNENKFYFKRLIVQGNISNTYGAIDRVSYNNLNILCYSTEEETEYAFQQLSKNNNIDVVIDKAETLEGYADNDYSYNSYTNWGAEAIDIGGYRQFLVDNSVEKEIVVVVMDTGINTSHSKFSNRLLRDESGKIKGFSYYNSTYQYSYDNLAFDEDDTNQYSFEDDRSHGSHVAGIVCDLTPENVKILPIKISDENGYSSTSVVISAYLRVINIYSKKYNIVCTNLSFSGAGKDSEEEKNTFNEQCYEPLMDINILPITAVGNDYAENNIEGLQAVVVSALKKQNGQYKFEDDYSNYGKIVDISAPGTNIYSASISYVDGASSRLEYKDGTSMASPQVAGVVALLYLNPNLPADFTARDIEQMLYDNCLDMGAPNKDIYYGYGMLNLKYFEIQSSQEELTFYRDNQLITDYIENENFENAFVLEIKCSNPEFDIIYSTDKSIPTLTNSTNYSSSILVNKSMYIYAMGIKLNNGQIVERTKLYNISYFDIATPIDECFDVSYRGYLTNYTGNYTHLTIPSTIDGRTICGIEPSVFKRSNLKSIILPDTLTTIDEYAFQYCEDLKFIYAPKVSYIYIAALYNCYSLPFISDTHPTADMVEGAYFPALTGTVGFTFSGCTSLESVNSSKWANIGNLKGHDFQGCSNLKSVNLPAITSIPEGTFSLCENLTGTFYIGKFVNSIGLRAFAGCKIKLFFIDESNNYFYTDGIGVYSANSLVAFACGNENINYSILDSVNINEETTDITTISESVMAKSKINNLIIPSSIININSFAFSDSQINTLYYNATNCSESGYYGSRVFYNINTIEIGANVERIPERLFHQVFFNHLIINSRATILTRSCFYRLREQGVLDKLTFNFTDKIDEAYLNMVANTSDMFIFNNVNYIYSKSEGPISSCFEFRKFIYSTQDDEYYIYSKEPLENKFSITSSASANGYITPNGLNYFNEGEDITFNFNANTGYYVSSIIVDGNTLLGDDLANAIEYGYTFYNLNANHSIEVLFSVALYSITYMDGAGNVLLQDLEPTAYTYGMGAQLPLPALKEGYTFGGWYENPDFNGNPITSISIVDYGNKTYFAKFVLNTYTITVIQAENGTISEAQDNYNYGTSAYFTITPNAGYHVEHLLIDGEVYTGSLTEYTFVNITDNHTISATFAKNIYTITASANSYGTITPSGNIQATYGDDKTFTFEAYTGYQIDKVYVDGVNIGNVATYTFNDIADNHTINVTFVINTYTITVIQAENGTISDAQASYTHGTSAYFTITPNAGYHVDHLIIDGEVYTGSLTEYTFTNITANHTISAYFAPNIDTPYTIQHWQESLTPDGATLIGGKYYNLVTTDTSKTGETGTLTQATANTYTGFTVQPFEQKTILVGGNTVIDILYNRNIYTVNLVKGQGINNVSGAGDYLFGQTVRLNATLIEGYNWLSWESSNTHVIASSSNIEYSFTMPASAIGFTANATIKQFNITISSTNNGHITPSTNQVVNYGANLELEFEADFGCELVKVLIDGNDVTASVVDNKYTISNIKENHTVSATFDLVSYSITANTTTNGTISPSGTTSVKHGNNQKYTFTANTGYHLASVMIDGTALTSTEVQNAATNGYTFSNVVANHTISATFAKITFTITATSDVNGTITPSATIALGNSKRFDFYPNEGYKVKDVKIDNVSIGAIDYYTFVNVDSAHTISVEYEIKKFDITLSVDGQGSLSNDKALENITYGEDRVFTISAEDGWELYKVYINGRSVNVNDNKLTINDIDEDMSIQAIFKEKETAVAFNLDTTTIAIIIGTAIISILLIALLIKSHKNSKRRKLEDSMHNVLVPENEYNNHQTENSYTEYETPYKIPAQKPVQPIPPNPMLQKALNFVQDKQDNFISFCNRYNIDYQNNYNNAALRYYQAYLSSLKPKQPPKNN